VMLLSPNLRQELVYVAKNTEQREYMTIRAPKIDINNSIVFFSTPFVFRKQQRYATE